eukprot:scaffold182_cov350-Prasinococcus_capsulatus_cf.AAC.28
MGGRTDGHGRAVGWCRAATWHGAGEGELHLQRRPLRGGGCRGCRRRRRRDGAGPHVEALDVGPLHEHCVQLLARRADGRAPRHPARERVRPSVALHAIINAACIAARGPSLGPWTPRGRRARRAVVPVRAAFARRAPEAYDAEREPVVVRIVAAARGPIGARARGGARRGEAAEARRWGHLPGCVHVHVRVVVRVRVRIRVRVPIAGAWWRCRLQGAAEGVLAHAPRARLGHQERAMTMRRARSLVAVAVAIAVAIVRIATGRRERPARSREPVQRRAVRRICSHAQQRRSDTAAARLTHGISARSRAYRSASPQAA